jgi:hypothetical protein
MANMGTVSVSIQQFPIKRKLQETKKPAHPSDKSPERLVLKLCFSFSPSEECLAFLRFGLTSCWKPFSMMGEACYIGTNITWRKVVKKLYFASVFSAIRPEVKRN